MEKEIADCPIAGVVTKVVDIERDMDIALALDDRMGKVEKVIESFKLKGWDLVFRIMPWLIAAGTILWSTIIK
jgi:hypothetical protein